jgi:DNA-binding MarR family transcriptional regulator
MWANFMQYLGGDGVPLREIDDLARITNLAGLERWGYITVGPDPANRRPALPRRDWIVRPARAGRRAQEVWEPLAGIIEGRWRARFGAEGITAMRDALQALLTRPGGELPHYLPVVSNEMFAEVADFRPRPPAVGADAGPDLSVLVSQALLAFTLDFERESALSLPICVNALRVLTERGVRVRDLPQLTGVSKEALSMAVGVLTRRSCAVTGPDPAGGRGKLVRLTPAGLAAQHDYRRLLDVVEERWRAGYGPGEIGALRRSLQSVTGQREEGRPRLSEGLRPYPGGWRAAKPYLGQTTALLRDPLGALPRYPMVLHRGGWPDGS